MKDYLLALAPEQCNTASLDAAIRRMDQEFERKLEAEDVYKRQRLYSDIWTHKRSLRIKRIVTAGDD